MNVSISDSKGATRQGILHLARSSTDAVILVSGAGGGTFGPSGIYPDVARKLSATTNITALLLDYKSPSQQSSCVDDVAAAISYLVENHKISSIALIGWSFGGAVVITAGALSDYVKAVCTIASQTAGTESVSLLAPKPLMLFHGTGDSTLSDKCSRILYQRANDPKAIVLYPGDDHAISKNAKGLTEKLVEWCLDVLKVSSSSAA